MEDVERQLKVLVVGNGCVGKSSMIRRLCKSQFCDSYKKTIGVDYSEAELDVPNFGRTRLMLWDTAGQEEFDPVTRQYYEDAHCVVLVFSTSDRDSFETIKSWRKKVEAICSNVAMVLVQNKIDLNDEASVSPEEAEGLARELKLKFYRASVKEYFNVAEVFTYVAELHLKREKVKRMASLQNAAKRHESSVNPVKIKNNFTKGDSCATLAPNNNTSDGVAPPPVETAPPLRPRSGQVGKNGENCLVM